MHPCWPRTSSLCTPLASAARSSTNENRPLRSTRTGFRFCTSPNVRVNNRNESKDCLFQICKICEDSVLTLRGLWYPSATDATIQWQRWWFWRDRSLTH